MIAFSEELKAQHPALDYGGVEDLVRGLTRARVAVSRASDISPVALIPFKARDVLQVALRRNLELASSFVEVFNAQLYVPLFVLSRAAMETGALALDMWDRIDVVGSTQNKAGLVALDEHLSKVLLGSKASITPDAKLFEAVNVLTLVDHLTKKHKIELRPYYDGLSEFAHPNFHGMVAAYRHAPSEDQPTLESRYVDRPFSKNSGLLKVPLNALATGLAMNLIAVETYEATLATFARLCEEDAHDRGIWPIDLAYPRP